MNIDDSCIENPVESMARRIYAAIYNRGVIRYKFHHGYKSLIILSGEFIIHWHSLIIIDYHYAKRSRNYLECVKV